MTEIEKWKEDARRDIALEWGDDGMNVLREIEKVPQFEGTYNDFLNHCVACGGNWGGMFLSGVKELYPSVYKAIPEKLGKSGGDSLNNVLNVLIAIGVPTWA